MIAMKPLAALALTAALSGCVVTGAANVPAPVPSAGIATGGGNIVGNAGGNIIAAGGGNVIGQNGAAAMPVREGGGKLVSGGAVEPPPGGLNLPQAAASTAPTSPGPEAPGCDAGFVQADVDADGAVTAKELSAATRGAELATYDADANGSLDAAEFCALTTAETEDR